MKKVIDIKIEFGSVAKKIFVARDLTPANKISEKYIVLDKINRPLKIIFLSRISPMKNLEFLISVLSKIKSEVEFNIFGPKEDMNYWEKCKIDLKKLPSNIKVNIENEISHNKVLDVFSKNDLLFSPLISFCSIKSVIRISFDSSLIDYSTPLF